MGEKARSKILELQSKVENLRAVLKKVTSTTATGSGGGGICDDLNIRHLLETPNKLSTSSFNVSDPALFNQSADENDSTMMNQTPPPQLTSTPRIQPSSHSSSFPSDVRTAPSAPVLSTPLSPKSKRRVSPIQQEKQQQQKQSQLDAKKQSSKQQQQYVSQQPHAPHPLKQRRENGFVPSQPGSAPCRPSFAPLQSLAYRSNSQTSNYAPHTSDSPFGSVGDPFAALKGLTASRNANQGFGGGAGEERGSGGGGGGGGIRGTFGDGSKENTTPRFLGGNLRSPYFPGRKRNT